MASPRHPLLALALLALACGQQSGGSKIAGFTGDGAASAPGQEAGPPGSRGGGGGVFGGGDDSDAAAPATDGGLTPGDAPVMAADAALDLPRDRPRDTTLTPVDAVSQVDSAPAGDSGDLCSGACQKYEDEYQAALVRARTCTPNAKLQCQMTAGADLKCPGCKVWVNSNVELDPIRMKWSDAGFAKCTKLCPQPCTRMVTMGICHSKMLAAPDPGDRILPPPMVTGTCIDQTDPVPF
jgi:hypothetical protein